MTSHNGLGKPPEGAIVGESVPPENPANELYESAVDELVGLMKTHPAWQDRSEKALRNEAAERIKRLNLDK